MGMPGPCSRSSFDNDPTLAVPFDYSEWSIQDHEQIGVHLVVMIHYPKAQNYEGTKVMVYLFTTLDELTAQKVIDPHFSKNKTLRSPFARFEPTENGWEAALYLTRLLEQDPSSV